MSDQEHTLTPLEIATANQSRLIDELAALLPPLDLVLAGGDYRRYYRRLTQQRLNRMTTVLNADAARAARGGEAES